MTTWEAKDFGRKTTYILKSQQTSNLVTGILDKYFIFYWALPWAMTPTTRDGKGFYRICLRETSYGHFDTKNKAKQNKTNKTKTILFWNVLQYSLNIQRKKFMKSGL